MGSEIGRVNHFLLIRHAPARALVQTSHGTGRVPPLQRREGLSVYEQVVPLEVVLPEPAWWIHATPLPAARVPYRARTLKTVDYAQGLKLRLTTTTEFDDVIDVVLCGGYDTAWYRRTGLRGGDRIETSRVWVPGTGVVGAVGVSARRAAWIVPLRASRHTFPQRARGPPAPNGPVERGGGLQTQVKQVLLAGVRVEGAGGAEEGEVEVPTEAAYTGRATDEARVVEERPPVARVDVLPQVPGDGCGATASRAGTTVSPSSSRATEHAANGAARDEDERIGRRTSPVPASLRPPVPRAAQDAGTQRTALSIDAAWSSS
ncbi:hypothetical protein FIBSPDRAFT_904037 [Athelia psychrophila]|uniref:Uncharacterized protein n=1 Tax=Athelia psychrophila TaxID=1759441 RepID=A0A167V8F0_9AGAM|nr:hypothetical protein FIBSPDRAFT_904037 [Fibularhizoctonia sp. CBS 109695]